MPAPTLSVRSLTYAWPGHPPLWTGLDLELTPGLWAVTGDESCGKTTLLRLLAGELQPQGGDIRLDGQPVSPAGLAAVVAWTDPRTDALDAVRVSDHLARLPQRFPGTDQALLRKLILALALDEHLDKRFNMLSTGSRRKVWIAAAIASRAPVILIDQPFAALDRPSARCVGELLGELADRDDRLVVIADFEPPDMVPPGHTIALDTRA